MLIVLRKMNDNVPVAEVRNKEARLFCILVNYKSNHKTKISNMHMGLHKLYSLEIKRDNLESEFVFFFKSN